MHCVYANASSEGYLLPRLRVGLYYIHVQTWLTAFPADQLMVVRLEDYSQNTAKVLQDIFTFLGVRHISPEAIENSIMMSTAQRANNNTKSYQRHGDMLSETKTMLADFYRPWNIKLAELLGDERYLYENV